MPCFAVALLLALLSASSLADTVSLEGVWKFRPGDDLRWADPEFDDAAWESRGLYEKWGPEGFPASGQMAWYRIRVDAEALADLDLPGIRLGFIRNAYEVYAGGVLLGGVGRLPPDAVASHDRMRVLRLDEAVVRGRDELVIALRVWGGTDLAVRVSGAGPHAQPFELGEYATLVRDVDRQQLPLLLFTTLIPLVGVFFLYLHGRDRSLRPFLWFGLSSVTLAVYLLTQSQLKHELGFSYAALEKLESCSLLLTFILMVELIQSIIARPIGWLSRGIAVYVALVAAIVALVPGMEVHYYLRPFWQPAVVVWIFPCLYAVVASARTGNRDAWTLLYGFVAFAVTGINDLLLNLQLVPTAVLLPVGFFALVVSMLIILANRFAASLESARRNAGAGGEQDEGRARIFISHASEDQEAIRERLLAVLDRHGIEYWISSHAIQSASEWERSIVKALERCDWFLLVMTPNAERSEWVKDELFWAIDHRPDRVLPLLLEDCEPTDFHIRLRRIQVLDFITDPEAGALELLARLAPRSPEPAVDG